MCIKALAKNGTKTGDALQKLTRTRTNDSILPEVVWIAMRRRIAFHHLTLVRYWHRVNGRRFPAKLPAARTEIFADQSCSTPRAARDRAFR